MSPRETMPDPPAAPEGAAFDPPAAQTASVEQPDGDGDWADRRELYREGALAAERATGELETTDEQARRSLAIRIGTIVVGFIVLIGGLAMMVLPGPGVVGVLAGLAILSRELPWAERWMEYVKKRAKIEELQEQPKWIQALMWTVTALAVVGSIAYFAFIR